MKEWYDGYQFGETDVYCPWDVINYCKNRCADINALPEDYWSNTSGNAMVRCFIDKADYWTKNEIEQLIAGELIIKEIRQDLTYNELDSSIENLWSVLFYNRVSELGYSDILIEIPKDRTGVAVEMKYAEDGDLERACTEALQQIEEKDYMARLKQDGMRQFIKYGIACYKKDCKVMIGDDSDNT